MKRMPTKIAEKVYDVLCKFAQAEPSYYQKEAFVFHYGVMDNTPEEYRLSCMDDAQRVFYCSDDGEMRVDGSAANQVNSILRKLSEELKESKK
jgi:hypothetical protein